jgi:exosortase
MTRPSALAVRTLAFGLLVGLTVAIFWTSLTTLIRFSFKDEHYSHIVLIPFVSACLVGLHRTRVFARVTTNVPAGSTLLGIGGLWTLIGEAALGPTSVNDRLSTVVAGIVVMVVGAFVLCYGLAAVRAARFPVLFLFLMVPIPDVVLSRVIFWLQTGSAEVSAVMFELTGVPVLRTGFLFALPGVTIEVARECSGIRSSLALLITSLLAGHMFLRSVWAQAALALATLPLLIVKNGIRIVTLSLLSIYVDPGYLDGSLHHQGGIVFFVLALILLAPVLRVLQKSEQDRQTRADSHA